MSLGWRSRAIGDGAEKREREAERADLYRATIESSGDAIFTKSLDGVITSWNPGAEHVYGYTAAEAIGRSVDLIVPDDRRHEVAAIVERIRRGERVEPFDTVRHHRDGRAVDVAVCASPLRDASGAIRGASVIARDVTERRQAEEQFRLAVEACPAGMVLVSAEGDILLANSEMERIFGYEPGRLVGTSVDALVPESVRERHGAQRAAFAAQPTRRALGTGRDLRGRRRDGSEVPVEVSLSPVSTRQGLLVLGVVVDITERKRSEEEVRTHREELLRSNAALEEFAYVASHDLQEPLRMVASYSELLGERYRGRLDERADRYIAYATEGARRMQRLITDILAYSRVGTQGRAPCPVDSEAAMGSVLEDLSAAVREADAEVDCGPLPWVVADEVQLRQLLQNLLGNAIKFRAEAPPRVVVRAQRERDEVVFSVADNGIGIDPAYKDKVFRMFQRLHARGTYEGSGIGLALARRIVERHGGRIWFESKPGDGTTFHFTLRPAARGAS